MSDDQLLTPQQYDLFAIDKPERQRKPRPEAALVADLRNVFVGSGDKPLWMVARKLYESVGIDLARKGLLKLVNTYGWLDFIVKKGISPMTQVSRLEQAAAASDAPRETVEILVEMKRRQKYLNDTQLELTNFLQTVHTSHPAMRKQIKAAAEMVLKGAFAAVPGDPAQALPLVVRAVGIASKDTKRIENIKANYRVPKETANWLIQIVARLAQQETSQ